jgi:release factor glutamine methyltransferase
MDDDFLYEVLLQELTEGWQGLPDKPGETPRSTLNSLWELASGSSVLMPEGGGEALPVLDGEGRERLRTYMQQRLSGVPLAYLTGRQAFLGVDLLAGPGAMIPRKETEILGRAAIETARSLAAERGAILVADLCTGSGNLALAVAYYEPLAVVTGADLSPEAVELACQNAAHLNLTGRVNFQVGDLFTPIETGEYLGKLDLLICNPPYISSVNVDRLPAEIRGFEPRLAFDGGPFGVQVLSRLVREAPRYLKPGSYLCFEVGLGQGPFVVQMIKKNKAYDQVDTYPDDHGDIRAVRARSLTTGNQGTI